MLRTAASRLGIVLASGLAVHLALPPRPAAEPRRIDARVEARIVALESQIVTLTDRISELERDGPPNAAPYAVKAPFQVVDKAGKVIFKVTETPRAWQMLSEKGEVFVSGSAVPAGGFVKALGAGGGRIVVMGVAGKFGGVQVRDADDASSARVGLFLTEDGKSGVAVHNDNHTQVATLGLSKGGGGYLVLGNANGDALVEAGGTPNDCGLVRAYPTGNAGVGLTGRPPWLLLGLKGNC